LSQKSGLHSKAKEITRGVFYKTFKKPKPVSLVGFTSQTNLDALPDLTHAGFLGEVCIWCCLVLKHCTLVHQPTSIEEAAEANFHGGDIFGHTPWKPCCRVYGS